jgi:hypothetical protein
VGKVLPLTESQQTGCLVLSSPVDAAPHVVGVACDARLRAFVCQRRGLVPSPAAERALSLQKTGYASVPAASALTSLAASDGLTIEAWVFARGGLIALWDDGWSIELDPGIGGGVTGIGGSARVRDGLGDEALVAGIDSLRSDRWLHIAVTRVRATGAVDVFVDGLHVGGATLSPGVPLARGGRGEALVGARAQQGSAPSYSSASVDLDELRVWSYARTAVEIDADRGRQASGDEEGLALLLPFDDDESTDVSFDASGEGLHARLVAGARRTASQPPFGP